MFGAGWLSHEVILSTGHEKPSYQALGDYKKQALKRSQDRSRGGKATKALTTDQEKLALKLIADTQQQNNRLSKTAACTRAAAELKSKHSIEVSKESLLRLLRTQK
jgi:hypothetical protein